MQDFDPPPSVVVGIDGSEAAVGAALWAIDEAVARDIPLRLLYAIDPREAVRRDADSFAHRLATAEIALRYAFMAVEASRQPVKIEIEIVQGHPVTALTRASRSAAMVCVGASRHSSRKRVGSTASALVSSAHCAVAMLRGQDSVVRGSGGWIMVELDQSPQNGALVERAIEEARLRRAPLRALTRFQSQTSESESNRAVAEGDGDVRERPDPQLATWIRRYPDMDIRSVAVRGRIVDYLTEHASSVKLVVVRADDLGNVEEVGGLVGHSVLHDTDCPLLIVRGNSQA
ncbi:MAG: universal stress protein [Mycobacterium sp.]|jgi:nucleotide-binding universal stress UspA family protein|nr:universal stress protein [Mycobacterium sp.]MBV8294492.1 universal stress protein [Mycobacterium sp.]